MKLTKTDEDRVVKTNKEVPEEKEASNNNNNNNDNEILAAPWNTMATMDLVLRIAESYINKTGRQRNVNPYIRSRLPPDKNISPGYIRVLRSYGGKLKKAGLYEQAMKDDWPFVKIIEKLKEREKEILEERHAKKLKQLVQR